MSASINTSAGEEHHYALEAASLLQKCTSRVASILTLIRHTEHHQEQQKISTIAGYDEKESINNGAPYHHDNSDSMLEELREALKQVEHVLHAHLLVLLQRELSSVSNSTNNSTIHSSCSINDQLSELLEEQENTNNRATNRKNSTRNIGGYWYSGDQQEEDEAADKPPTLLETASKLEFMTRYKRQQAQQQLQRMNYCNNSQYNNSQYRHKQRQYHSSPYNKYTPPQKQKRPHNPWSDKPSSSQQYAGDSSSSNSTPTPTTTMPTPNKKPEDSLLFRLILSLQLLYVRIEEAHDYFQSKSRKKRSKFQMACLGIALCSIGSTMFQQISFQQQQRDATSNNTTSSVSTVPSSTSSVKQVPFHAITQTSLKYYLLSKSIPYLYQKWTYICISARLHHSTIILEEWVSCWVLLQCSGVGSYHDDDNDRNLGSNNEVNVGQKQEEMKVLLQRLTLSCGSTSSSFWHSLSNLRYALLKRGMDVIYASMGTAIEYTKSNNQETNPKMIVTQNEKTSNNDDNLILTSKTKTMQWNKPFFATTAAVAASYYSVIGPSSKSQKVVSASTSLQSSSQQNHNVLLQNVWGMMNLPAVKKLSLQVSKIWKGASIAERIYIGDVPCFVLSRDPFPALAAALKRYHRQQERTSSHLTTILETSAETYHRRSVVNIQCYPKRNIIFHITGGGFFAHTIAGDLPFLLDWSASTNAIVIVPEYSLLPDYAFPTAIDQITELYCSVVSGDAAPLLGVLAERVIVTGESAGGNLAAALCVKLCVDQIVDVNAIMIKRKIARARKEGHAYSNTRSINNDDIRDRASEMGGNKMKSSCVGGSSPAGESLSECGSANSSTNSMTSSLIRLPDAVMLSCPALNLCLDHPSPSRLMSTADPVLPGGLLSAISDAYVPPKSGVSKTDPIASPYYAPDEVLRLFPPTLLFASSGDPLLDDSVDFNARLLKVGVESTLRAVHNVPHAFWGLGTAGFPEVKQVQLECQYWLIRHLHSAKNNQSPTCKKN